jgi:hypothetical protein
MAVVAAMLVVVVVMAVVNTAITEFGSAADGRPVVRSG